MLGPRLMRRGRRPARYCTTKLLRPLGITRNAGWVKVRPEQTALYRLEMPALLSRLRTGRQTFSLTLDQEDN